MKDIKVVAAIVVVLIVVIIGIVLTHSSGPVSLITPEAPIVESPNTEDHGTVPLHLGETARFTGISISPQEVVEDSRCPQGVMCIWAGSLSIKVSITTSATTTTRVMKVGDLLVMNPFSINLVAGEPIKTQGILINPAEYVFTFDVEKL